MYLCLVETKFQWLVHLNKYAMCESARPTYAIEISDVEQS